jgi:hypothetical protein
MAVAIMQDNIRKQRQEMHAGQWLEHRRLSKRVAVTTAPGRLPRHTCFHRRTTMSHLFGWSLPPGVTGRMIDEAFGREEPCQVCGQWEDDCVCPECPTCGEFGNPACYDGALKCSWCGTRPAKCINCATGGRMPDQVFTQLGPHGLVRSLAQVALRAEADKRLAADNAWWDRLAAEIAEDDR